jgi:hypothetical protein
MPGNHRYCVEEFQKNIIDKPRDLSADNSDVKVTRIIQ